MTASKLFDRDELRNFLEIISAQALRAGGSRHPPGVLHINRQHPNGGGFFFTAHNIGDVDGQFCEAMIAAEAGNNVYSESRTINPGYPWERGKTEATIGKFAFVSDRDADRGKGDIIRLEPSLAIETSPGNFQDFYFWQRALSADGATTVAKYVRANLSVDSCSGMATQCHRLPGLPNLPTPQKVERGRVICRAKIVLYTNRLYMPDEFIAAIPKREVSHKKKINPDDDLYDPEAPTSYARHLISFPADELDDRSAHFQRCINHCYRIGTSPSVVEDLFRSHPEGCSQKYLQDGDRLREEIGRSYEKARQFVDRDHLAELLGETANYREIHTMDDPIKWHRRLMLVSEMNYEALRVACYALHHCLINESGRARMEVEKVAKAIGITESAMIDASAFLVSHRLLKRLRGTGLDGHDYELALPGE